MAAGPQGPMEGHTGGYGPPGGQPVAPPPQGGYPPTAQSGYPPSGYDGRQQQQGPGLGERASEVAHAVHRQVRTPETKPFYTTSEFLVWLLTVIGVLIAGAVIDNGDHGDALRAGT